MQEEVVEGYIEKIVFRNAENGYTVFSLSNEEGEVTCVGSFTFISEGEFVEVKGSYSNHAVYGMQLKVSSYEVKEPEDLFSMERYLGSGAIKGIGTAMAGRIVRKFKGETFRIIEEEPERLAEIKGISERIARDIALQFEEKRDMRTAMIFLQKYGISGNLAVKIHKQYGDKMYDIIEKNPYKLADDIKGIGFKIADEIAGKVGIAPDSDFRIQAGIIYLLQQASQNGHVYLPENQLYSQIAETLAVEQEKIEPNLMDMVMDRRIIIKEQEEEKKIYLSSYYYMELNTAKMLIDLNISYPVKQKAMLHRLEYIQEQSDVTLDEMQQKAVIESAKNGVFILTGGPGTGKTTTINAIIKFFETEKMDLLLAAPTGRAAKRMSETTGYEAQTIHRLLEQNGGVEEDDRNLRFERNADNPLETDVIIIDEMSMVDIHLMHALLKAIAVGTRLILVGDVNQLPSVGPGNVLHDIIESERFTVVKLAKIFRQAAESDIIVNAHKINAGEMIKLDNKSKDFFHLERTDADIIQQSILYLVKEKIARYIQADPYEIQVLTPMRKGELGVERLNELLQNHLNPPAKHKKEKEYQNTIFREGDKVMQIKNNYQLAWEMKSKYGTMVESGTGVFNGDVGKITEINLFAETVTVEFDEGKVVEYKFVDLEELELAYAITIHKSQGSEYPAVVIPLLSGPKMLFNRNLLYTAVTRAKKCVMTVGRKYTIENMIQNNSEQKRFSGLKERICELL